MRHHHWAVILTALLASGCALRPSPKRPREKIEQELLFGPLAQQKSPPERRDLVAEKGEQELFFRLLAQKKSPPERRDLVAEQAASEFACSATEVNVAGPGEGAVYSAGGCGKHGVYMTVVHRGIVRVVLISGEDETGVIEEMSRASPPVSDAGPADDWQIGNSRQVSPDAALATLQLWFHLNKQAARDRQCPRSEVVVEFRSQGRNTAPTPLAVGCGKRAMYLPRSTGGQDVVSIVQVQVSDP